MDPHDIVFHPLMTEAASLMVEKDNKLVFIVNLKSNKKAVKRAVEELSRFSSEAELWPDRGYSSG